MITGSPRYAKKVSHFIELLAVGKHYKDFRDFEKQGG